MIDSFTAQELQYEEMRSYTCADAVILKLINEIPAIVNTLYTFCKFHKVEGQYNAGHGVHIYIGPQYKWGHIYKDMLQVIQNKCEAQVRSIAI